MRLPSRRALAAATTPLLFAALTGTLAACGSDDSGPSADTTSPTAAGSSASPGPTTTPGAAPTGPVVPLAQADRAGELVDPESFSRALAQASRKATTARIAMQLRNEGGPVMEMAGAVDYRGEQTDMAIELSVAQYGDQPMDVRLVDGVMYLSAPMIDPTGKFFRLDTNDPTNPLAGSLGNLSDLDPRATLDAFSKDLVRVTFVGEEQVDGEPTRRFEVVTRTNDLAERLGDQAGQLALPDQLTYDLWLDAADRMRRMETSTATGTMRLTTTDWGAPVNIQAPPRSRIAEMPQPARP